MAPHSSIPLSLLFPDGPSLSLCPTLGHNASTIPNNARPPLIKGLFWVKIQVASGVGKKRFFLLQSFNANYTHIIDVVNRDSNMIKSAQIVVLVCECPFGNSPDIYLIYFCL